MGRLDEISTELKQLRDEIALRIHLASMEVREEWEELEGASCEFGFFIQVLDCVVAAHPACQVGARFVFVECGGQVPMENYP